ncbi:glycosyltransferase family 52 [Citrobacter amalonaticus]|nr:glycosyltransferase family 52 [Citrobacter amalonaticus]
MNDNVLHICITLRQLLISICDALKTKRKTTIIFLIDYQSITLDRQKKIIKNFDNIEFMFLKESDLLDEFSLTTYCIPAIIKRNITFKSGHFHLGCKNWTPEVLKKRFYDTTYIYHSGPFTSKVIRKISKNIVLREDGLSNYVVQPLDPIKAVIRAFCGLSPFGQVWGEERWVRTLEVESPELLPGRVKNKAIKLTVTSLLNSLNEKSKKKFIDSFELNNLVSLSGRKSCLILTQPIDDVGFCNTKDKIRIYNKLAQKFIQKKYNVYVKLHPKEREFDVAEATYITKDFPVELLKYVLTEKMNYCIALCSSSLNMEENALAITQIQVIPLELFNRRHFNEWDSLVEAVRIED